MFIEIPKPVGRPNKEILLEHMDANGYSTEVLKVKGLWVVTYQGQPIGLRRTYRMDISKKYPRTAYNNPAFAYNMMERLNTLYNTNEFNVLEIGNSLD
jgi:hypothetical protein